MNELQSVRQELAHLISKVEDLSNEYLDRVRVTFANRYSLSIIRGEGSYGGSDGYFEIAPLDQEGHMDGSLFDEDDQGDDVLGWCDLNKVNHYMRKLAHL